MSLTNTLQLEFDQPIVITERLNGSIAQRFGNFHKRNPSVYRNLVSMAREVKSMGRSKASIKMFFELLRWSHMEQTKDPTSEYKLCNDYHSRYARLIMENESDLSDIFNLRNLSAE